MTKTLIVSMPACGKTTLVKDLNSARDHFDSTAVDVDVSGLRFTDNDNRIPYTQFIAGLLSKESRYSVVTSFTGSIDWEYLSTFTLPHELRIVFILPAFNFEDIILERLAARSGRTSFYALYSDSITNWNLSARVEYNLAADLGFLVDLEELDASRPYVSDVYWALHDFPCIMKNEEKVDSSLVYGYADRWLLKAYDSGPIKYHCAHNEVRKIIDGSAEFDYDICCLYESSRDEYEALAMAFVIAAFIKLTSMPEISYLSILTYCAEVSGVDVDKFVQHCHAR